MRIAKYLKILKLDCSLLGGKFGFVMEIWERVIVICKQLTASKGILKQKWWQADSKLWIVSETIIPSWKYLLPTFAPIAISWYITKSTINSYRQHFHSVIITGNSVLLHSVHQLRVRKKTRASKSLSCDENLQLPLQVCNIFNTIL